MSLRKVFIEWLAWGLEPDGTGDLSADEQRLLCFDIYSTEPAFLQDCYTETFASAPAVAAEMLQAFREGDFAQMGAVADRLMRRHLIGSHWLETELREVQEQETFYDGDQ